jgi:hypothetical protein
VVAPTRVMRSGGRRLSQATVRLLAVVLAATSCSSGGQSAKLAKEVEEALTSGATSELVVQSWLKNRVPTAYATRTLDEQRATLDEISSLIERDTTRNALAVSAAAASRRAAAAARLGSALERGDTVAVRAQLTRLTESVAALRRLATQAKQGTS